jgi:hypothetical protein
MFNFIMSGRARPRRFFGHALCLFLRMATGGDEELPAPTDSPSICCGAALTGETPAGVGILSALEHDFRAELM